MLWYGSRLLMIQSLLTRSTATVNATAQPKITHLPIPADTLPALKPIKAMTVRASRQRMA